LNVEGYYQTQQYTSDINYKWFTVLT